MGSEKYKLKWSKYESNILSAFHSLLESETLSDVTLFCEGQTFKAHRLVLAACSTHFETLFSHTPVSAPSNNQFFVILDGTRADDLQILLHFMYRGEAYLHQDRINSVLRTAEVLQVKGLSEGPRNIEINQNLADRGRETGNGGRSWSPSFGNPDTSPRMKKKDLDDHLLRRGGSPSPMGRDGSDVGYYSAATAPPTREPFPMFGGPLRNSINNYQRSSHLRVDEPPNSGDRAHFSPGSHQLRSKSPGPPPPPSGGRYSVDKFGSPPLHNSSHLGPHPSSSDLANTKEERDPTPMSVVSAPDLYESRSISRGHDSDRPPSNKTDCHTPNDYDRRTPTSLGLSPPHHNKPSSAGFPSDSTTDNGSANPAGPGPSGLLARGFKPEDLERLRRSSDPSNSAPGGASNEPDTGIPSPDDQRPKFPADFRNARDMEMISNSTPQERNDDARMTEDEIRNRNAAATSLETFRRLAMANANIDRDHLLPRRVPQAGLTALVPGLTASDYMRFAMPVRDPDNGDAISGSGTKLKCPFCERTYGYETNLRAHIRQRHQGIRVSCPYCPRTFTRNNTVRRHVQREHRHLAGRIPTKFGSTRVMPDPISQAVQQQQSRITSVVTSAVAAQQQAQLRVQGGALPNLPSPPSVGSPVPTSTGGIGDLKHP